MSGAVSNLPSVGSRPSGRTRRHRDLIQQRVRFGFLLLVLGYIYLAGHLVYIQVFRHHYYQVEAARIRLRTMLLPAQRGGIYDRNGAPLAVNIQVGDVIADPTAIADPQATAQQLAQIVPGLDAAACGQVIAATQKKLNTLGKPVKWVPLVKGIPYAQVQAFAAEMRRERKAHIAAASTTVLLAGLSISPRQMRSYPNGDLASQVVGFVSPGRAGDQSTMGITGDSGIERSMNRILAGSDGSITAEKDAQGRTIPGTESNPVAAVPGRDVTLTIDSTIQRIAQDELEKSFTAHHAASGTVVVLDPRTGEILALATLPTYDPNHIKGTSNLQWHNGAVTDLYEPGSTMKTLTLSAVMDTLGLESQHDTIFCSGELPVGGHIIHCAKDPPLYGHHGTEDMREVLQNSCNIGAAQFAMMIGPKKLFQYEQRFGLLEPPGSGLPTEGFSRLKDPVDKPWSKIQLANIAFGQGISITPLQVASIYATIANGGVRVHPYIIQGRQYQGPEQQVVKPEVASAMLSMLQTVVLKGTGQPAQIAGYNVGGKTGSAQMAEHGRYGDQYVGSFCGIAPVTRPRLVILCSIFKPKGVHWGAVVAAPVVHNIAQRALWYLKVPPDNPSMVDYADRNKKPAAQRLPA